MLNLKIGMENSVQRSIDRNIQMIDATKIIEEAVYKVQLENIRDNDVVMKNKNKLKTYKKEYTRI